MVAEVSTGIQTALNIKSPEAHRLVTELARLRGVREQLERENARRRGRGGAAELLERPTPLFSP
jgi:hypothetical protein